MEVAIPPTELRANYLIATKVAGWLYGISKKQPRGTLRKFSTTLNLSVMLNSIKGLKVVISFLDEKEYPHQKTLEISNG